MSTGAMTKEFCSSQMERLERLRALGIDQMYWESLSGKIIAFRTNDGITEKCVYTPGQGWGDWRCY